MPRSPRQPHARLTVEDAARKPLLGFGWPGIVLLFPLAALVTVAITGYDLRYQIQKLVLDFFGVDALYDFTIYGIISHSLIAGFWTFAPRFGPIGVCIVMIALQIHPRRVPGWRAVPLWLFAVFGPPAMYRFATDRRLGAFVTDALAWEIAGLIWALVAAAMIRLATRSWRVALACLVAMAFPVCFEVTAKGVALFDPNSRLPGQIFALYPHAFLGMHAALAAILLAWAIHARRSIRPAHACQACGYDLRGLAPQPCPECGHGPEPANVPPATDAPNR